jgi:hypothetical protein
MGKVLPRSASPERIFADFAATLKRGKLKGGAVATAVEARLGPLGPGISKATADAEADKAVVDDLDDVLMEFDKDSDLEIGATLDEAWNALGGEACTI